MASTLIEFSIALACARLKPADLRVTPALLHTCANLDQSQRIALYLPRFRVEGSTIGLARELQALGMKTAFDLPKGCANFDRAAPRRPNDYLTISEVFHQTFIAVDEHGTEAAAATVVAIFNGSRFDLNPPKPIEVRVDHPFFFAIQERKSGICLFLGSVVDPK
jgi:serpin B